MNKIWIPNPVSVCPVHDRVPCAVAVGDAADTPQAVATGYDLGQIPGCNCRRGNVFLRRWTAKIRLRWLDTFADRSPQTRLRRRACLRRALGNIRSARLRRARAGSHVVYRDLHALFGRCHRSIRQSRIQRQFVAPRGKVGRDHYELSRCICNRSIKALAVAQQVYSYTRGRPSGDDGVASSFSAGNVKRGCGLIRGEGAWRSGKFNCIGRCFGRGRCERRRALTPHDRGRL